MNYDLIIKNAKVVRPGFTTVDAFDIAITEGKIALLAPQIDLALGKKIHDASGCLAFPGVVDAHMHCGIYQPLKEDAWAESRAAAQGGVTSSLNYMRTGQYYLNKTGPYRTFFPEVLAISAHQFWVDYAYHLAPMTREHITEIEYLIENHGVMSFKIFMFYGSHGLHGKSSNQRDFLMIGEDEKYDFAHFEFIMRGVKQATERFPQLKDSISLSLHCETAEIMAAYTKIVETEGQLTGLAAYSASRPPHSEGLAIFIAAYLAHETNCVNINLLHLSSRKAVDAAMMMQQVFPHISFRREVTIGHLLLDTDTPAAWRAKVNPPIRPRADVEALWEALLDGKIDWVVSDHACCRHEIKTDPAQTDNIWVAKSGFGGTEYLLSGLFTEGSKRGLSYNRMAELLCKNPAKRFGLTQKGDIAVGLDADIVLLNPDKSFVVRADTSESAQGYTPFEGMTLKGQVEATFLRGHKIYEKGQILGKPLGKYIRAN